MTANPMARVEGASYQGQPVYRQINDETSSYFSREVKPLPGGGWKFVRWLPLTAEQLALIVPVLRS